MYITITTTSDSKKTLNDITTKILKDNLSPCIQLTDNLLSSFKWKKKIKKIKEYKILIKTHSSYQDRINTIIGKMHNYDVPEIISQKIDLINNDYEEWFSENLK